MPGSKELQSAAASSSADSAASPTPHSANLPGVRPRPRAPITSIRASAAIPVNGRCTSTAYVYMNRTGRCVARCEQSAHFAAADLDATRAALTAASVLSFVLTTACLLCACAGGLQTKHNTGSTISSTSMGLSSNSRVQRSCADRALCYSAFCFAFSAAVYLLNLFQKKRVSVVQLPI